MKDLVGNPADGFNHRVAALVGGRDIKENQLIGSGGIINTGLFDRVAGVAQVEEVHAFHNAPVG